MTREDRLVRVAMKRYVEKDRRIPLDLTVALLYAGIIIHED